MKERLIMSNKECDRLGVIKEVINGKKKWREASEELGLSMRQVGNLVVRVKEEGNRGIVHRLRGRASNHRLESRVVEEAIRLVKERYSDFGPTLANEKLYCEGIKISTNSLRTAMINAKIWKAGTPKKRHRAWRERRAKVGMMVLLDGSDHEWFEKRGKRCVLLLFIDDATSLLKYGVFVVSEDKKHLMMAMKEYIKRYGRPNVLYVDRDSIYKTNRQATVEEGLRDRMPETQFTRAMSELGITVICALSPQAKGRVERAFETLQDRLVKEMRLAGISDMVAGTKFFNEVYAPMHNKRFARQPAQRGDAHRRLLKWQDLNAILSIRTMRVVSNDWTVRYDNKILQLLEKQPVRILPRRKVEIEERLDGSLHMKCKGRYLHYKMVAHYQYKPLYARRKMNYVYTAKPGSLAYASHVSV